MNKKLIKNDLKRLPMLFSGIFILSIGIYLTKVAYIGLSPWHVFHDGISRNLDMSFGNVTTLLGLLILFLSVLFLKTKVGVGTILNILVIGNLLNLYESFQLVIPENVYATTVVFTVGFLLTTFGRSLYIASDLGQGPRDGLFVGFSRITNIDVKYVKPAIEFTILIIGVFLGGNFGIGTIILVVTSGYFVQLFFKILGFNPKKKTQSDIRKYILRNKHA
jgi:uncharacterized membrane protein YczE